MFTAVSLTAKAVYAFPDLDTLTRRLGGARFEVEPVLGYPPFRAVLILTEDGALANRVLVHRKAVDVPALRWALYWREWMDIRQVDTHPEDQDTPRRQEDYRLWLNTVQAHADWFIAPGVTQADRRAAGLRTNDSEPPRRKGLRTNG